VPWALGGNCGEDDGLPPAKPVDEGEVKKTFHLHDEVKNSKDCQATAKNGPRPAWFPDRHRGKVEGRNEVLSPSPFCLQGVFLAPHGGSSQPRLAARAQRSARIQPYFLFFMDGLAQHQWPQMSLRLSTVNPAARYKAYECFIDRGSRIPGQPALRSGERGSSGKWAVEQLAEV